MKKINFDAVQWFNHLKIATAQNQGYKDLRKEIFMSTVEIVQAGGYLLNDKSIAIPNQSSDIPTHFFHQPHQLPPYNPDFHTQFSVIQADCVEVAEMLKKTGYRVALLNMADRRNPGGGVLGGAGAQEENLFRRSNLYLSLYPFSKHAISFNLQANAEQYPLNMHTGGIFSQSVSFFRSSENSGYAFLNTPFTLDVVSVPAISNPTLVEKNGQFWIDESLVEATKEKMRTILRITGSFNNDCIVLSAFGCGAFCNPPHHVAALFKSVFTEEEFRNRFKMVVFAIIDDHNAWKSTNPKGNYIPFRNVFDE